jgi:hypothetical protein
VRFTAASIGGRGQHASNIVFTPDLFGKSITVNNVDTG